MIRIINYHDFNMKICVTVELNTVLNTGVSLGLDVKYQLPVTFADVHKNVS